MRVTENVFFEDDDKARGYYVVENQQVLFLGEELNEAAASLTDYWNGNQM